MDNDGRVDIVSGFSPSDGDEHGELPFKAERDGIWLQQTDGRFLDVSQEWGLDSLDANRAGVVIDLDRDGWLDVVKSARKGPAVVHRSRCGEAGWLGVSLAGPEENPHGLGARVQLEAVGRTQTRWIMAMGPGYMSSQPPTAHFGVGDVERIDSLTITWPDGGVSRYTDITPRQYVEAVW